MGSESESRHKGSIGTQEIESGVGNSRKRQSHGQRKVQLAAFRSAIRDSDLPLCASLCIRYVRHFGVQSHSRGREPARSPGSSSHILRYLLCT